MVKSDGEWLKFDPLDDLKTSYASAKLPPHPLLAPAHDIDVIASRGLIDRNWQARLPNNSSPYTSAARPGDPDTRTRWRN